MYSIKLSVIMWKARISDLVSMRDMDTDSRENHVSRLKKGCEPTKALRP
jgi:hypothetical protein